MNIERLGALALTLGLFAGPAMAQDISIGLAGPMTGQYASFGIQLRNGAKQAVADINAAGGVLGRKLGSRSATTPAIPNRPTRSRKSSPGCG